MYLSPRVFRSAVPALLVVAMLSPPKAVAERGLAVPSPGEGAIREVPEAPAGLALRGPVDEKLYIMGPGDRLSIMLWGRSDATHTVVVSPEGAVILPGLAPVPVAGSTLEAAKSRIVDRLGEVYRNVEIGVALTGLRTMRINVLGRVVNPGEYTGTALDLAGDLIERAGGLGGGASDRNIIIRRRTGGESRVDLARYRNAGDMSGNPPILDGDVIFVPQAVAFVEVSGAVAWPRRYELAPGDTFESLMRLAGGFARGAVTDTVYLRRFVDDATTKSIPLSVASDADRTMPLVDGDQLYVQSRNEWRVTRRVVVEGEAVRPGPYGINEGSDRLSDVLRRAGGPTAEASLPEGVVLREFPKGETDPELVRLADVPVSSMSDTEYAYWASRLREDPRNVVTDFRKVLEGDSDHDILLRDGDLIVLPKLSLTVRVSGQVANPGRVPHVEGKRYSYYVAAAGGYESGARRGGAKVVRAATGEWVPAGPAGRLEPGDEIWIPERREGATWNVIKDVAQLAASVATAYLLIDQVTK
jgi:protein involved in polysaccharide export with SLBB domain